MDIYADELTKWLENYYSNKYNFFSIKPTLPSFLSGKMGMRFARFIVYPFHIILQKSDIFHILDHGYAHLIFILSPRKTIVTVHDLIPYLNWKGFLPGNHSKKIPIFNMLSIFWLRKAKHIIANSLNTKNDLVHLLGINPEVISVVHLGIDPEFRPYDEQMRMKTRKHLFANDDKSIKLLITGSNFYKNHETALKTVRHLIENWKSDIKLIKTGIVTNEWKGLVNSYGLDEHVINLGILPRESMVDLYNTVDILLFPSLYEGFGWPPLEAMACGTPVIASNAGSLPEVIGQAAKLLDPFDYLGFASETVKIISNSTFRQSYIQKGFDQANKYSWENTANDVINIYENFLR
jgi:glycosyltransferase involved in cell wall biosynthesis